MLFRKLDISRPLEGKLDHFVAFDGFLMGSLPVILSTLSMLSFVLSC